MTAVVIGATGGLGAALAEALAAAGQPVLRLSRRSDPPLDLTEEATIAAAAEIAGAGIELVIDASGFLHDARYAPEKSLRALDPAHLARQFAINAIGPALVMKHFLPRLARDRRAVFATLSARVGSITDNRLGGWYGYRAAKAARNQLLRSAAIEIARTHPQAICVALHPGTVATPLSAPFVRPGPGVQSPSQAAARLLAVLDALRPADSGGFFDHLGKAVPF